MSDPLEQQAQPQFAMSEIFALLAARQDLTTAQTRFVFGLIMSGQLPDVVIAAFVGALLAKGESVDELVGAAEVMRANVVRIRCQGDCIDTCGTGGDGVNTFNVSTAAAIIAAAAGAIVAKHGNRSATRVSGSTEVLGSLGINTSAEPAIVEKCLREVGIGYLNAQALHPTMKYAAPVRRALPTRTIFNLLGPLTNPAGAKRQLLGVPKESLVETMAEALCKLGADHVWVVHGASGLCDVTITGSTVVAEVQGGTVRRFTVAPADAGLSTAGLQELLVGSPEESAAVIRDILDCKNGPHRDHALMNAGAALVVAGLAEDLATGVAQAARAIDDGAAADTLQRWKSLAGLNPT